MAAASRVRVVTVRLAYEELERAGVIATRQGKGSVVAERSDRPADLMHEDLQRQLEGVLACAARLGLPLPELHRLIDQATEPDAGRAANTTNRKDPPHDARLLPDQYHEALPALRAAGCLAGSPRRPGDGPG